VATAASAAASAGGMIMQGQQQKKAGEAQAKTYELQAEAEEKAAGVKESIQREQDRRLLATQRMRYGVSGVETEGSPLTVMADSALQAELDARRIRYGGELQAGGWRQNAKLQRWTAGQYGPASYLMAGSTLLTGLSSAVSGYYNAGLSKDVQYWKKQANNARYDYGSSSPYGWR
jgi:hypothetical protein